MVDSDSSEQRDANEFLDYVSSQRGLAQNTRVAYEQDLLQFLEFCGRKKISIYAISLSDVRYYVASMRRQDLSPRTIARKVSALRQFYRFLILEGKAENDPTELLSVTVREKRLPKHLTVEEIFALLAAAKGENENELRDRALLEFWYGTGTRVSEMAGILASDIDWKDGTVKVTGKGSKQRLIPVNRVAVDWCLKYQIVRHEWLRQSNLKETGIFFLTRRGKPFNRQGIWKIVKKYAKLAGIAKNVWPHMIRHSFATHVLAGGADLRSVQELLGHRSIATTEIYTHLSIENLKVMQQKYHPRD